MADPLVEAYVTNTAAHILGRDLNSAWDSAVSKFTAPKPAQSTIDRTGRFKSVIEIFTKHSSTPELNRFRIQHRLTIEDVQREASAALEAYDKRGSSYRRHFLRTAGRDVCNNAWAIEELLNFLPNGDYTAVLCGALFLVFNAAKRVKAIREQILTCLNSLTRTVNGTKSHMQLYPGNRGLWEAAEALYIALLDAIEGMLEWLDEGAFKRTFSTLFKQQNHAKPLEDKIKTALDEKVKVFYELLQYCQHERIQQVEIGVDRIIRDIQDTNASVKILQKNRENGFESVVNLCNDLLRHCQWLFDQNEIVRKEYVGALRHFGNHHTQLPVTLPSIKLVDGIQLLSVLSVDPAVLETDHRLALQSGYSLQPAKQGKAAELMRNPRFQVWLQSSRSQILVVNGKDEQSCHNTMSPLTYFTAILAQTLAASGIAAPLAFLCGTHSSHGDPLQGVSGMLRYLVTQLLLRYWDSVDLSFIDYAFIEAVRAQDVRYLCALFRGLILSVIGSIGQCAIICMIDGVSFFETDARKTELEVAIASLQQLVLDAQGLGSHLILKILLTYPGISRYARDRFPPESILTLSEESRGDGHGYGSSRMAAITGEVLRSSSASYM